MAAFEDFDFFARGTAAALLPRPPRAERDALRSELERIHVEVARMRNHIRRRSWSRRLLQLVTRQFSSSRERRA